MSLVQELKRHVQSRIESVGELCRSARQGLQTLGGATFVPLRWAMQEFM